MRLMKNTRYGILFVAVTIIWTWGVLSVPIILDLDFENTVTRVAYVLAGASPSLIGILFVFRSLDKRNIRIFLKRIVRFGNATFIDLLLIFLLIPVVTIFSAFIGSLLTSAQPDWSVLVSYCQNPVALVAFAAYMMVFGPLAEEIGWRGYLLDQWKDKGILVYGAGIGFIWTIWHLPMFFISGTYQNALLAQGIIPVLCFVISTTALGVIIGKIAKRTDSILAAIMFHFMINFTGELIPLTLCSEMVQTALLAVIALVIVVHDY